MKLFKIDKGTKAFTAVPETNAFAEGLLESKDIESWMASNTAVFDRHVLWLCRQDAANDADRTDLVGIDDSAELALVELKRGTVAIDAVTQALRYLPEYAKKTREELAQLLVVHQAKFAKQGAAILDDKAALVKIDSHVSGALELNEAHNVLLVGEEFAPETLATCEYLNRASEAGEMFSIECWRLKLHKDGDELYVSVERLVPTPDLQQEIERRREQRKAAKWQRDPGRMALVSEFRQAAQERGWAVWTEKGASYYTYVEPGGDAAVRFGYNGIAYLSVPVGKGYDTAQLTEPNWKSSNGDKWIDLGSADLASEPERKKIVDAAIERLQNLPRAPEISASSQAVQEKDNSPSDQITAKGT